MTEKQGIWILLTPFGIRDLALLKSAQNLSYRGKTTPSAWKEMPAPDAMAVLVASRRLDLPGSIRGMVLALEEHLVTCLTNYDLGEPEPNDPRRHMNMDQMVASIMPRFRDMCEAVDIKIPRLSERIKDLKLRLGESSAQQRDLSANVADLSQSIQKSNRVASEAAIQRGVALGELARVKEELADERRKNKVLRDHAEACEAASKERQEQHDHNHYLKSQLRAARKQLRSRRSELQDAAHHEVRQQCMEAACLADRDSSDEAELTDEESEEEMTPRQLKQCTEIWTSFQKECKLNIEKEVSKLHAEIAEGRARLAGTDRTMLLFKQKITSLSDELQQEARRAKAMANKILSSGHLLDRR